MLETLGAAAFGAIGLAGSGGRAKGQPATPAATASDAIELAAQVNAPPPDVRVVAFR